VQIATKFKIPLIVWGAHQGIDQVGMFSHLDEVEMTRKYRKEHDLMGFEAEDLVNEFDNVTEIDMRSYFYPDNREIERVGVRGIYLNNFIRWDSRAQHEEMIRLYGYEAAPQTRTFDSYNDVDCWNYSDVHDYVKVLKHGYGKVTDHACREIRLGRLSRAEGAMLVAEYGARPPRNLGLFLEWLRVTESAFHYIIDQHRNPAIWRRDSDWNWIRIDEDRNADAAAPGGAGIGRAPHHQAFEITPRGRSSDSEADYILIGKGAPQN
jgi:hypothetical protein